MLPNWHVLAAQSGRTVKASLGLWEHTISMKAVQSWLGTMPPFVPLHT